MTWLTFHKSKGDVSDSDREGEGGEAAPDQLISLSWNVPVQNKRSSLSIFKKKKTLPGVPSLQTQLTTVTHSACFYLPQPFSILPLI